MYIQKLKTQTIMDSGYPVVKTEQGLLRGLLRDQVFVFRGIKYADAGRFRLPAKPDAYKGIRDAFGYGYACPEPAQPMANDHFLCPHLYMPQQEDCQYLNIWTRGLDAGGKRPVMVWLHGDANHGGSWCSGSGVEQFAYDGEEMCRHGDVMVVSLNHRLGSLGFLNLTSFGGEYGHSAHAGLLDIVAALEWIQANIAAFGGDSGNVTLLGHSGGGDKILALMQMPVADILYHKAAVSSCNFERFPATAAWNEETASKRMGELVAEELGLTQATIQGIDTVDCCDLFRAAKRAAVRLEAESGTSGHHFGPVVDGEVLVNHPADMVFRPETKKIPMLIGSVFGEGISNALPTSSHLKQLGDREKNAWDMVLVARYTQKMFGAKAGVIMEEFARVYPEHRLADALFMDDKRRVMAVKLAQRRAAMDASTWNWMFKLEFPIYGGVTAWHGSEIPFIFHNAAFIESSFIPEQSDMLQDVMCGAWVAFAKSGDPNGGVLPTWARVTAQHVPVMLFDKTLRGEVDHDQKLLALMNH